MYLFIYLIYLFSVIAGKGNTTEGYLATLHKRKKKKPCVLLSRPERSMHTEMSVHIQTHPCTHALTQTR